MIVDAGIKIVETAGSNPAPHLPMFHDNGIKVLHKCTSVRHAVKAQSLGGTASASTASSAPVTGVRTTFRAWC